MLPGSPRYSVAPQGNIVGATRGKTTTDALMPNPLLSPSPCLGILVPSYGCLRRFALGRVGRVASNGYEIDAVAVALVVREVVAKVCAVDTNALA